MDQSLTKVIKEKRKRKVYIVHSSEKKRNLSHKNPGTQVDNINNLTPKVQNLIKMNAKSFSWQGSEGKAIPSTKD